MDKRIELDSMLVIFNTEPTWTVQGHKKTRIYGNTDDARVAEIAKMDTHPAYSNQCGNKGKSWHDEYNCTSCVNDRLWKVWNRAEVKSMKESIVKAFETEGLDLPKITFSRTAGCGCGCSAGHVADVAIMMEDTDGNVRRVESIHIR